MEITLEKLQELIIEPEQMKEIAGIQEEMLDYSATIELMAKVVEARPIKPEEQAGLAPIDRISWFVRNAYIAGYMMAVDTLNEATKAFIADFIGGGVHSSPNSLQAVTAHCSGREGGLK